MKNKIILLENKKASKLRRTKLSGLFGMSFVLMLLALFTTQCKEDDFTGEVVGVCPAVVLTSPLNGAIKVVTNKLITATFNVAMEPSTIDETTFIVRNGEKLVSGTVTYNGMTATFSPTNLLAANTVYSATMKRQATDLAGNLMRKDTTWSFNTGTIPEVVLTDPTQGVSDVPLNKIITADFSTAMDASTIGSSTFVVKQGANIIAGTVSYAGIKATFTPTNNLITNKVYTATITKNAKDLAGNALAKDTTWSFATGVLPIITVTDPLSAAKNVAINRTVNATFSKVMSATTINLTTFTLKQGATMVSGLVSYKDMTATFTPTASLMPDTEYTATITTGVRDLLNNSIVKDSTWKFTTSVLALPILPYVISTNPSHLEIGFAVDKSITATFSKAMTAATINSATFTLVNGVIPASGVAAHVGVESTFNTHTPSLPNKANNAELIPITGVVTYANQVATFKPNTPLLPGTVYTATVSTGVKDTDGNAMAINKTWSFTTVLPVVVLPTVVSTDPTHMAVNVALDKSVSATFSTAMNSTTINATTFTLVNGLIPVPGVVTYVGMVGTFNPNAPLLPGTVYTATVSTGVKDMGGNAMAINKTWSFTTIPPDAVLPYVISTNPNHQEVDFALDKSVTATFSKTMNATTINTSTFTLMNGLIAVPGVVTYVGMVGTFNPSAPLLPGTVYTATVSTGVKDTDGNAMAVNKTWNFTTMSPVVVLPSVISTDPNNLATNVALDKSVSATFSKAMNSSTINTSTFTLMNGLVPVAGVVTYAAQVGTFNPNTPLLPGTVYTATVTTGVKDTDGNAMAVNKTWSFTTIPPVVVLPVVVSTDPNNLATNVALDKSVSATFSKTMNSSTINTSTFKLMNGLIPVAGVVTYVGMVGTFNPNAPLLPGTVYAVTVTTGVKDTDGNAMAVDKTWSFTTLTPVVKYTVTLVSFPVDGGTTTGAGQFDAGSTVTVKATAKPGFKFDEWSDGGLPVATTANYSFVLNGNRTLMAKFSVVNSGPLPVDLGAAGKFAILAGAGISNTGVTTKIIGDVGSFPTATINGLNNTNVIGILYTTADPIVGAAKNALTTAYNDAAGRSLKSISLPGQLGGLTLEPGLYVNSSTSGISGTGPQGILTLDAQGNPNAVWIFKMGSTLITDAGTKIVLAGGAQAKNIFWSVGTSATLGTNSIFFGNILADQSITLTTGATLTGRALTRVAAVTLDSNAVTKP